MNSANINSICTCEESAGIREVSFEHPTYTNHFNEEDDDNSEESLQRNKWISWTKGWFAIVFQYFCQWYGAMQAYIFEKTESREEGKNQCNNDYWILHATVW